MKTKKKKKRWRCITESVRMYPALPLLNRECTLDYKIPGSGLTIKKGTPIIISLIGMMRDAVNFAEPMKFMPERFLETNSYHNPTAYIPFGDGPRACIGSYINWNFSKTHNTYIYLYMLMHHIHKILYYN